MARLYPKIPETLQDLEREIARAQYMLAAYEREAPISDEFTRPTMMRCMAEQGEELRRLLEARQSFAPKESKAA